MRGKRCTAVFGSGQHGITPADAGKTRRVCNVRVCVEDHPRGCGENRDSLFPVMLSVGSPPRMRGKLEALLGAKDEKRITPADAGKTGRLYEFRVRE